MRLNTIKPAAGSKHSRKRAGRGMGSGLGKTCGRGHKGQHARSGGYHKVGFEGGQMPLQRRVPKLGFVSTKAEVAEIRLHQLSKLDGDIDLAMLKKTGLVAKAITKAKIIAKGELNVAVTVKGLAVTAGARKVIEAAGGKIIEDTSSIESES